MKFEERELGTLGIEIIDGDRGKNYPHKDELLLNGDCLFLSATNVTAHGFQFSETVFITKEKDNLLRNGKLRRNDIVITTRGTVGNIALYDDSVPFEDIRINSGMLIVRCNGNINEKYLAHILSSQHFYNKIKSIQTGSAQPQLPKSHFCRMTVPVPEASIQNKIASILSCLDNKISVNQKINDNLLEQVDVLYREFSTRKAWPHVCIGELAQKIAMGPFGSNIKVSTFVPSGIPIISGNHLRGYFLEEPSYNYITEEHAERLKNSIVYPGDIVFTHAGNIGQVAMIPNGCDYEKYVLSQRQFYLRCDMTKIIPEYVTLFFHSNEGQHELLSYANQTGVPSIAQPATNLKKIALPVPPISEQEKFAEIVRPMINKYQQNTLEIRTLTNLRNSLIPKLMSGELDVTNIKL